MANEVDFDVVSAWCEKHDNKPTEGWLTDILTGVYTIDQMKSAILSETALRDPVYRCACSWVGGDPDVRKGKPPTCPACWHHDRKRVEVKAE